MFCARACRPCVGSNAGRPCPPCWSVTRPSGPGWAARRTRGPTGWANGALRTGRGPIGPEAWAETIAQLHLRDREAWCHGVIRALATAKVCAATVTGLVEATDLETTAPDEGGGHVTRTRKSTDTRGHVHEIEVVGSGWKRLGVSAAQTTIPLAARGVPIQAHATLALRAWVTQARTPVASHARLPTVVCDPGVWEGVERWWLDQHGIRCVVPAKANLGGTVDAPAHAAAGAGVTVGRRVHTVRQGQGQPAGCERRETAVVGSVGLPPDDQDGTPAHGRHATRRDFQPHPITAVVVRQGTGHAYGPAGTPVFVTKAPGDTPVAPCDDDAARRLLAHGSRTEPTQPWRLTHPPQKTARAVHVHVSFTWRLVALATASRLPRAQADTGGAPGGWQRGRRQRLEPRRDHGIGFAQGCSGLLHRAAVAR